MNFTTDQIDQLMAALPGCTDERKQTLVPMILAEWGRIDVEEHLSQAPPQQVRAERELLKKLASSANELAHALSSLARGSRFAVAYQLSKGKFGTETALARYNRIRKADRRLGETPATAERLAAAVTETAAIWDPLPLRHSSVIRYLILLDLAAIFEYATDQPSGRRVRTDLHVDAGEDYGPFWDFASAIWAIIFGSTRGLGYAVKFWAKARAKHGEWSPVILNMDLRHPEWRIFGH
jgi:hypothetical protein